MNNLRNQFIVIGTPLHAATALAIIRLMRQLLVMDAHQRDFAPLSEKLPCSLLKAAERKDFLGLGS